MGMAASQARLLTLTARIHDVEYQAQSIQNAKVQLSTQQDQVYREYTEALDASTLTFASINSNGEKTTLTANFNNLFSSNRARTATGKEYALKDSKGRIVLDENLYNGYTEFSEEWKELFEKSGSAYAFALYMMGESAGVSIDDILFAENEVYENSLDEHGITDDEKLEELLRNVLELNGYLEEGEDISGGVDPGAVYNTDEMEPENETAYREALDKYLNYLYKNYSEEIYNTATTSASEGNYEFDTEQFNYYLQLYSAIEQSRGCVSIEDFNGFHGDAKNDSEWLTAMIQSGQMSIEVINKDPKSGKVTLNGTSPSSDDNISYTPTTTVDKVAMAKAEAKYEHDTKIINQKEKQLDLSLSKLETERSALTTEYDSVKKVIQDNIERTFGIFS